MRRVIIISLLVLLALLAAGAGTAWYLLQDEDFLRNRLAAFTLDSTGRELRIDGALNLRLGRQTTLDASGIHLANAPWAGEAEMASIGHLRLTVDVPSLFHDTPLLPLLQLEDCRIALAENKAGENNWDVFAGPDETAPPEPEPPQGLPVLLLDSRVANCEVRYDSPQRLRPLRIAIDSLNLRLIDRLRWQAEAAGRINEDELSLSGWMEPQGAVLRGDPSEHEIELTVGAVRLHSAGRFANSRTGAGADLELQFEGPELANVLAHLGLPLFSDGAFDFRLALDSQGPMAQLRIDGDLGRMSARAEGQLDRLARPTRGSLQAAVSGPRLDLLGQAFGLEGLAATAFGLDAAMSFKPGQVLIESTKLEADGDTLTIRGTLGTEENLPNSDLQFDMKSTEIGRWAGLWDSPASEVGRADLVGRLTSDGSGLFAYRGSASLGTDTLVLDGPLGFVSGPLQANVEFDLRLDSPSSTAKLLDIVGLPDAPLTARGKLQASPERVQLGDVRMDLGNHHAMLSGEVTPASPFTGSRLTIQLETPDLAELGRLFGQNGLPTAPLTAQGTIGRPDQRLRLENVGLELAEHRLRVDGYVVPGEPRWSIENLDARLSTPDASALARVLDLTELPAEAIDLTATLQREGQGVRFNVEQAETPALRLHASGSIPDLEQPLFMNADFDVQLRQLALLSYLQPELEWPDLPVAARGKVRIQEDRAVLQDVHGELGSMTAEISGHIGNDRSFALVMDAQGPDASELKHWLDIPLTAEAFSIQAQLAGDDSGMELPQLELALGPSRATARLKVENTEPRRLSGSINSSYLDLTDWVAESPGEDAEDSPEQQAAAFVFDDRPINRVKDFGWEFDLEAELDEVVLANGQFTDVRVGADVSGQRLEIDPFSFRGSAGGQVTGQLMIDFSVETPRLDLELHGENVRSGILSLADQDPSTIPSADVTVELQGSGLTRREMASSLDGRVRLHVGPGRVASSSMEILFADFITELLQALNPFSEKSQVTNLECMVAAADLNAGQMEVFPVVVNTEELTIFSKGNIDLRTEDIALSFNTKPRKGLGITTGVLINPFIKVGGTLARPAIELDPANAIVSGGAAVATAGLTLLAKGFADRFLSSKDPCGDALKEIDKRDTP